MVLRMRTNRDSPIVARYGSIHDEELCFEELVTELQAPSARLLEATALFLVELARRGDILVPHLPDAPDALRRVGFIADHLGVNEEFPEDVRRRLKVFADRIFSALPEAPAEDLGFSKSTTKGRIRRLKRHADAIDRRWRVWGEVELREEFLQ